MHFNAINVSNIVFLQVSDATGSMKLTKVSEKSPFAKNLLVRDDCFILDNGANGKIFVWKGEKNVYLEFVCVHMYSELLLILVSWFLISF